MKNDEMFPDFKVSPLDIINQNYLLNLLSVFSFNRCFFMWRLSLRFVLIDADLLDNWATNFTSARNLNHTVGMNCKTPQINIFV